MSDTKMSKEEYEMMHDINVHGAFTSSTYEVVHKDFYNDFGGLFKPLVEELRMLGASPVAAPPNAKGK